MDLNATTLVNVALQMTTSERARIVAALIDCFDGPTDPDFEAAWADEIEGRVSEIKSGRVTGRRWEDVKARARQARGG